MHIIFKQSVLNTKTQFTQYLSNVCSVLKHSALNI